MTIQVSDETRRFRDYFNATNPLNQRAQGNTNIDSLAQIARFIDNDQMVNEAFEGKRNDLSAPISEYLEALIQAMLNMHVNEDEVDNAIDLHKRIDSKREFIGGSPLAEWFLEETLAYEHMGDPEGFNKAREEAARNYKAGLPYAEPIF